MDNNVRSRTDHYETLRVARTASGEEISRAFAEQMRTARMRPDISVVRLAALSVAYETLRDPIKRRAYDASIGIVPKPVAPPMRNAAPFIGIATIDRLNRLADPAPGIPAPGVPASGNPVPSIAVPRAPQQPLARGTAEDRVEPRVAGFIAASLREPAREAPQREPTPPVQPAQPAVHEAAAEPLLSRFEEASIEDGRLAVGRTAATLGASVIGVAILSIVLALPAPNPDRLPDSSEPVQEALTVALPPAAAADDNDVELRTAAAATVDDTSEPQRAPRAVADAQPTRSAAGSGSQLAEAAIDQAPAAASTLESFEEQPASTTIAAVETTADTAPDDAAVATTAARLPLPNATVARTIHRIGYACGRVVSTTGVDGAADGVFKVTCSSGDSYQAAPVRGRYHFRRWSNR